MHGSQYWELPGRDFVAVAERLVAGAPVEPRFLDVADGRCPRGSPAKWGSRIRTCVAEATGLQSDASDLTWLDRAPSRPSIALGHGTMTWVRCTSQCTPSRADAAVRALGHCGRDEYTGNRLVWTPNDGFTVRMTARGTARQRYLRANRGFHDRFYGRTLRFGRSVRLAAFRCTNRRSALTCTNWRRHGWWLGRYVGYRLFSVPPAIAAASITTCWDRSFEDLKAKNIRCDTAEGVYRKSRRVAQQDPDLDVTRFKFVGLRWTCRASNPPHVPFYTWRCRPTRSRLMQYRWKSGD